MSLRPAFGLRPDHGAAAVRHRCRLLLPILRPWRHRPKHRDAVYPDLVDLLVEEAEMALDLGAFRDRVGIGPDEVGEHPVPDLDRIIAGLALIGAARDALARREKVHAHIL